MEYAVYNSVYYLKNGIAVFSVTGLAQAAGIYALNAENLTVMLAVSMSEKCGGGTQTLGFQRNAVEGAVDAKLVSVACQYLCAADAYKVGAGF